jgi:hypothetical protein
MCLENTIERILNTDLKTLKIGQKPLLWSMFMSITIECMLNTPL